MTARFLVVALLALANLLAFAVAEAAPGSRPGGSGLLVAVVDTGVSPSGELAGRLLGGVDLVEGDHEAGDPSGHGTAVASAVARSCAGCSILPVRVLTTRGDAPWSRVAAGIVSAVDHGARVVNVSIAGAGGSPSLRAAVEYATSQDVLVVAAAGNEASSRPEYPAAYPGVVAVAAAAPGGGLYRWSSRGGWVDVRARGCSTLPDKRARSLHCGTSFAAAHVAGVAALARARDAAAPSQAIARRLRTMLEA